MPFDPKLVPPDEAPVDSLGELDLPDELRELAAQLADDAAYLAERYPAGSTAATLTEPAPTVARSAPRTRHWRAAAAAAATIAAVGLGALAWAPSQSGNPSQPQANAPAPAPRSERSSPALPESRATAAAALPAVTIPTTADGPRIERLPWAPQLPIGEVSNPELEGLLDLWQNDGQEEKRISI